MRTTPAVTESELDAYFRKNHTPGPWKIERPSWKRGGNKDNKQAITAGSFGTVCVCTRADHATDTDSPNARLIAAAPELLEIAKAYRNLLRSMAQTDGECATYAHVESVIVKAI